MTAQTRSSGPSDQAVLATLATAFLIREGGQVKFTQEEWQLAIDHEGTLWVAKEEGPVMVVLIASEGARA